MTQEDVLLQSFIENNDKNKDFFTSAELYMREHNINDSTMRELYNDVAQVKQKEKDILEKANKIFLETRR